MRAKRGGKFHRWVLLTSEEQLGLISTFGVLSALMLSIVITSQTSVTMDEWYNYSYRQSLIYSPKFRLNLLQYLTTTGQNLSVVDGFGPLDISAVLNQHVETPDKNYAKEIQTWDNIMQIERIFHATRDVVPNNWKTNYWSTNLIQSVEGRYWVAIVLLGLACVGSVSLYASVSMSAKKEMEQTEESKEKQQAVVKAVVDALEKYRSPTRPPDTEKEQAEEKDSHPSDTDSQSFWKYLPSGVDMSITLMALSLVVGTNFAVWGLLDVGIARFPNGYTVVLMYDFWIILCGSVLFTFYVLTSIQAFLDGGKISTVKRWLGSCRRAEFCPTQ